MIYNGRLRIYEQPIPNTQYILGVDPSKGTGKHDSCIQILKVYSIDPIRLEQVATFQDNKTNPYNFTQILNRLSVWYNDGIIMVENNGEGSAVVHHLWWTFESQSMYCESQKATGMGINANSRTKSKAVLLMKKLLEEKQLQINDYETAKQLSTFIEDDSGRFRGQDGLPDDLVSALYWAAYSLELDLFDTTAQIIKPNDINDEAWGILADVNDISEGWNW